MQFGMNKDQADAAPRRSSGGGFIKYPRAGENILRIYDEPAAWIYYNEHYNPDGYSFPCTEDQKTCPGCTSDNEKMSRVGQKVAFNAVTTYEGKERMDVWKVPRTAVADRLEARYHRSKKDPKTIRDRDFLIVQSKNAKGRVEYDVEGMDPEEFDFSALEEFRRDPSEMLAEAYEQEWGSNTGDSTQSSGRGAAVKEQLEQDAPKKSRFKKDEPEPPKEDVQYSESDLRKMDVFDLAKICKDEGLGDIPKDVETPDEIVDWMISQD